tara:strand:- start:281 stop:442 length:162 start_codon:yes stop_codon:yes gene_type:complete
MIHEESDYQKFVNDNWDEFTACEKEACKILGLKKNKGNPPSKEKMSKNAKGKN